MARPDFVTVWPSLDLVEGELHFHDRRGRLVGLLRGVQIVDQPARPSDGPARSEPAGDGVRAEK